MPENGKDSANRPEDGEMLQFEMEVPDDELYMELDDDRRQELDEMLGLKVIGVEVWEESLGDDEDAPTKPAERIFFDCDLFLDGNQAIELYVTAAYPDPDDEPVSGLDAIYDIVGSLADRGLTVIDYGSVDEEGGLALAFGHDDQVDLVLAASAWMVAEWEADDEESEEG